MVRVVTLALAAVLTGGCNGLFYYPDAVSYSRPETLGTPCEVVSFVAEDGALLRGWFLPATGERRGTVVHFHGNAQNLSSHVGLVSWLPAEGYDVLAFDYRGYGQSAGEPSRAGLVRDGRAALAYVRSRADVDEGRLLVFGQSLGGAVALATVGEGSPGGVRGVAVDATFSAYQRMGNQALGGSWASYPLAWLLLSGEHDPADSLDRLPPTPLLVLHGDADEVVPFEEGERLFELASPPKRFVRVPRARHLDAVMTRPGREALLEFFDGCLRGS
jgi:fermentation-respiration switch protein FrsA (DUF1100 family)